MHLEASEVEFRKGLFQEDLGGGQHGQCLGVPKGSHLRAFFLKRDVTRLSIYRDARLGWHVAVGMPVTSVRRGRCDGKDECLIIVSRLRRPDFVHLLSSGAKQRREL